MINFNSPQGSVFIKPEDINVDFKKHLLSEINITWYTFNNYRHYSMIGQFCELCGEIISIPDFDPFDEEENVIEQTSCTTLKSIVTETSLLIESGEMLISNGITDIVKPPQSFTKDLIRSSTQSKQGRINNLKFYEENDILAVYTEGSPTFYKKPNGDIIVASLSEEDAKTTDWKVIFKTLDSPGFYCATDYQNFLESGYDVETLMKNYETSVIKIRKGVYRFTNYTELESFNPHSDRTIVFSNIEEIY